MIVFGPWLSANYFIFMKLFEEHWCQSHLSLNLGFVTLKQ